MTVFENVGVIPLITIIQKNKSRNKVLKIIHKGKFENHVQQVVKFDPNDEDKEIKVFKKNYSENRIKVDSILFADICYMSKGMVINSDEKTNKGAFTKDDLISFEKNKINSKEFVEGKDLGFYRFKNKKYLEWNTKRVPSQLSRSTFNELYEGPKIMRGRVTPATYDYEGTVCNDGVLVFKRFIDLKGINNKSINGSIKKNNSKKRSDLEEISANFDLKYLLAIINSKYAFYYLNNIRRHRLKNYFYPDDFRKLPIPEISSSEQKPFIQKVDLMLRLNKEFYEKKDKFLKLIKHEYKIEKITKKLDKFYELEFDDFMKQLKVNLSMDKKSELLDFFEKNKKETSKLKGEIDRINSEIDIMVYKLYGLTDEEIKIVEEV